MHALDSELKYQNSADYAQGNKQYKLENMNKYWENTRLQVLGYEQYTGGGL